MKTLRGRSHCHRYGPQSHAHGGPHSEPYGVKLVEDMYECARDAEVLVIATEWSEYANADLQKLAGVMRNRIILTEETSSPRQTSGP